MTEKISVASEPAQPAGYRHIDTAWKYGTERQVGEGIRASGVPRADIFLCTKVSHEYLRADDFARCVDESLATLGVALVDHFRAAGAFTLASTHLTALKIYGANTKTVLNASMGFDEETLAPHGLDPVPSRLRFQTKFNRAACFCLLGPWLQPLPKPMRLQRRRRGRAHGRGIP